MAAQQIAAPLTFWFNWSLEKGHVPKSWKHAKICPFPKDNKQTLTLDNSCSISILPAIDKLLETIVSEQIWNYMENNDLITAHQHAYMSEHSTATALVEVTDQWLGQMDKGNIVGFNLVNIVCFSH